MATISICHSALCLEVEGTFYPSEPESGPSYASGGDPGCDAYFEIERVFAIAPPYVLKRNPSLPIRLDITSYIDDIDAIQEIVDNNLDQLDDNEGRY